MFHKILVLAGVGSAAIYGESVTAQDSLYYRVKAEDMVCLANHIEKYLEQDGDPLFISLVSCPSIPEDPLMDITVDAAPSISFVEGLDKLLVLSRVELGCLKGKTFVDLNATYVFYPAECRIERE